ncbi:hypothetical protein SpCBS45565_g02413 [Spizellomyces sp. 'palustris']|nr:hypothetical protein SpCBS45565_g02413 [Spizellomyces sp. 'palustris']
MLFIFIFWWVGCTAAASAETAYRTFNGSFNNQKFPDWGSKSSSFARIQAPLQYSDGLAAPYGISYPSPRKISNAMGSKTKSNEDKVPDMLAYFGQFLAHDSVRGHVNNTDRFDIPVPCNDPHFDPYNTCNASIPFGRLRHIVNSTTGQRVVQNWQTAWIDASQIYGEDEERCRLLRKFKGGLLRTSLDGLFLPTVPVSPPDLMLGISPLVYLAGSDYRANDNPALLSLHTLFVREHNRRAAYYAKKSPDANDETLFQMTRKWIIACLQKIAYKEYFPRLLGGPLPKYGGYDESVDPGIDAFFFAASFRYGHSAVNSLILRLDKNWEEIPSGHILLREAIANPTPVLEDGIEPILRGLVAQLEQKTDVCLVSDLRNYMPLQPFMPDQRKFFDLGAFNIQRGREIGLPSYNEVRKGMGLTEAYTSNRFRDITSEPVVQEQLATAYDNDVTLVDPYVGGLAEASYGSSVLGELFQKSVMEQYIRIRDGDAFWYERDGILSADDIADLDSVTLSNLILWNTDIKTFPVDAFSIVTTNMISSFLGMNTSTLTGARGTITGSIPQTVQLTDGLALTYLIHTNTQTVDFVLESNHSGWFAIGLGTSMMDADIMAVFDRGDGTWVVEDMRSTVQDQPSSDTSRGCTNDLTQVADISPTRFSTRAFSWTRKLVTGDSCDYAISDSLTDVIYAYSTSPTLTYHGGTKWSGKLNFFSGVGTGGTGGLVDTTIRPTTFAVLFHACDMLLMTMVAMPLGIYIARYGTRIDLWLPLHQYLMAAVLSEFAFTLRAAFSQVGAFNWEHAPVLHVEIGRCVAGLGLTIGAAGWLVVQDFKIMSRWSLWIRRCHRYCGLALYLCAIFNGWLGIADLAARYNSTSTLWPMLYIGYFGLLFLIFFGGRQIDRFWDRILRVIDALGSKWFERNVPHGGAGGMVRFMDDAHIKQPKQEMTLESFIKNCQEGQCWTIISGMVVDLSRYMDQHPGGVAALRSAIGKDATNVFQGKDKFKTPDGVNISMTTHSRFAMNKVSHYVIAKIYDPNYPQSRASGVPSGKSSHSMTFSSASRRRGSLRPRDVEYGLQSITSAGSYAASASALRAASASASALRAASTSFSASAAGTGPRPSSILLNAGLKHLTQMPNQGEETSQAEIAGTTTHILKTALLEAEDSTKSESLLSQGNFDLEVPLFKNLILKALKAITPGDHPIGKERLAILVEKETVTGLRARNPIRKFRFALKDGDRMDILPGDAISVSLPTPAGGAVERKYTPVRCSLPRYFDAYIKASTIFGAMTPLLDELEVAASVKIHGPVQHYSNPLLKNSASGCYGALVMLAAGTGIAPMIQLIDYYLRHCPRKSNQSGSPLASSLTLIWCNNCEDDIFLTSELKSMESASGGSLNVIRVLSHPASDWEGHTGRISAELIREALPKTLPTLESMGDQDEESDLLVTVCGPPDFTFIVMQTLGSLGVLAVNIRLL